MNLMMRKNGKIKLIDHFKLIDKNDLIQESLNILTNNNDNISPNFEENKLQLHRDEKQQPLSDIKLINKLKNEKGKKHNKNLDDFVVKVVKNEKELLKKSINSIKLNNQKINKKLNMHEIILVYFKYCNFLFFLISQKWKEIKSRLQD